MARSLLPLTSPPSSAVEELYIRANFYHPQANGGVEKFNQGLKNSIRAYMVQGYMFQAALNLTLMHNSASQHISTQASPALLMLGRELELPLDRFRPQELFPAKESSTWAAAKAAVTSIHRKMKDIFEKRYKVK